VWSCPRCSRENADEGVEAVECPCGLRRKGWLGGPSCLEYSYPLEEDGTRAIVKGSFSATVVDLVVHYTRVQRYRSEACEGCGSLDCEEAGSGWEEVGIVEGQNFGLQSASDV
jgi:DNA-directed RNA polymerase subunit RPC12/RpoP